MTSLFFLVRGYWRALPKQRWR